MKKDDKQQLFENSYEQLAAGIFRYVYFKVSDYELAEDITAETFIRYWTVLSREEKVKNHKALLYLIARGQVVDFYRRKKQNHHLSLDEIDEKMMQETVNTDEVIDQRRQLEQVNLAIKKLKKDFQEILILRFVEDLTIKEVSTVLNKTENATRVLLHRALKALRNKL